MMTPPMPEIIGHASAAGAQFDAIFPRPVKKLGGRNLYPRTGVQDSCSKLTI
jgi:hypothetical protein